MLTIIHVDQTLRDNSHREEFDYEKMGDDRHIFCTEQMYNALVHLNMRPYAPTRCERMIEPVAVSWTPRKFFDPYRYQWGFVGDMYCRAQDDYRPRPMVIADLVRKVDRDYDPSGMYPPAETLFISSHEPSIDLVSAMGFSTMLFREGHKK